VLLVPPVTLSLPYSIQLAFPFFSVGNSNMTAAVIEPRAANGGDDEKLRVLNHHEEEEEETAA